MPIETKKLYDRPTAGDPTDPTVVTCPRRVTEFGPWERGHNLDRWRGSAPSRTCSFCGSVHPEDFMAAAKDRSPLTPTDKAYKVYLGSRKFYFPHLSEEQQAEFFRAHMAGEYRLEHPGRFYVLPFFFRGLTR